MSRTLRRMIYGFILAIIFVYALIIFIPITEEVDADDNKIESAIEEKLKDSALRSQTVRGEIAPEFFVGDCIIRIERDYKRECTAGTTYQGGPILSGTKIISLNDLREIKYFNSKNKPAQGTIFFEFTDKVVDHIEKARLLTENNDLEVSQEDNEAMLPALSVTTKRARDYLTENNINSIEVLTKCPGVSSFKTSSYSITAQIEHEESKELIKILNQYHRQCSKK